MEGGRPPPADQQVARERASDEKEAASASSNSPSMSQLKGPPGRPGPPGPAGPPGEPVSGRFSFYVLFYFLPQVSSGRADSSSPVPSLKLWLRIRPQPRSRGLGVKKTGGAATQSPVVGTILSFRCVSSQEAITIVRRRGTAGEAEQKEQTHKKNNYRRISFRRIKASRIYTLQAIYIHVLFGHKRWKKRRGRKKTFSAHFYVFTEVHVALLKVFSHNFREQQ